MNRNWYSIDNQEDIESPALLAFPERIKENIRECIRIAGSPTRLRPHVKTHKLAPIVRMHLDLGIKNFKCATLAEAKMIAESGGKDILLAYPLYGPMLLKFIHLAEVYPDVRFSTLIDRQEHLIDWEKHLENSPTQITLFVDIDNGMARTGIPPHEEAFALYHAIVDSPQLKVGGLHIYDGHIRNSDFEARKKACDLAFEPVELLIQKIRKAALPLSELACGGSPTFTVHALYPERMLSPGTYVFWDKGYSDLFPEMNFQHAAVLLCRVVSKPGTDALCLDLGHKALASEMPPPRVFLFEIPEYTVLGHSEEHLVISCANAAQFQPGDCLYGIPQHICPTTALHEKVWVVENAQATETWTVEARKRIIDI